MIFYIKYNVATGQILARTPVAQPDKLLKEGEANLKCDSADSSLPADFASTSAPWTYYKIVGGKPVPNDTPESTTAVKKDKAANIDATTRDLIAAGFKYQNKTFSLSTEAQVKMMGADLYRDTLTYPVVWNTVDDQDTISFPDAASLHSFVLAALAAVRSVLDAGTSLKDQVRNAKSQTTVNAVADSRKSTK